LSFESVKIWVEGGKGSSEQIRAVALSSLKKRCGEHYSVNDNMIDFVIDNIVDGGGLSASQTWENYSTNIVLRGANIPDHFEWEERKNYTVVCAAKDGMHRILAEGSAQVGKNRIIEALDKLDFTVKFDSVVKVDFKAWWRHSVTA
jgi:hypothetical protein